MCRRAGLVFRDGFMETTHLPQSVCWIDTTKARDLPRLLAVWESSVRATHSFLTEADIHSLSPLVEFAIRVLGADQVDVNEQNQSAIGFYLHLGFRQIHRLPVDGAGKPFPIVHLALR
jgi:hypothetical protein